MSDETRYNAVYHCEDCAAGKSHAPARPLPSGPPTPASLAEVEERVEALESTVKSLQSLLRDTDAEMGHRIAALESVVVGCNGALVAANRRIQQLESDVTGLKAVPFKIETCGACFKRFTPYADAPSHITRGQPRRHELMPNVILCEECFKRCQALEDGAFL